MKRLIPNIALFGFLIIIPFISSILLAQDDSSSSSKQVWLDYNPNKKIGKELKLFFPMGIRTTFPNEWYRAFVNPYISYNWPRLILKKFNYKEQLLGGVGLYYTLNIDNVNRLEIRPFQGYSISIPNRVRLVIKHYFRLEERFEIDTDDWKNTFGLRFRYTGSATLRFQGDVWERGKGFYIPIKAEFFWNLIGTNQFNDKFRFSVGLGRDFSAKWKAAFIVGYFYTRNSSEDSFHSNDILFRFRVHHNIN